MAMSGLRTIRFPTRRNFIAFLATPSFVFNPRNVKKTRNQDLSQTGFQNFDMGSWNESFEDPDDFPRITVR